MMNVNIETNELYRLQLEFPEDFYAVLQNVCSFSLDFLTKKIDEVINEANQAEEWETVGSDGKNNYREIFTKMDGIELEFEPFIVLFSTVRKNMVFIETAGIIKGKDVEHALELLRDRTKLIGEKYPTTHNYAFTPEEYMIEKADFVSELKEIKQIMLDLDEEFVKNYPWLLENFKG